jgi:branched-chain amino acid aminotransferase
MIDACPAWKNFKFCTVKDLNVNVLDLGFIHSDATYDVISIRGIPNKKLIDAHINRFIESCNGWRIPLSLTEYELYDLVINLYEKIDTDCLIWLCATRGTPISGKPRDLQNCSPNLMAYAKPYYGFNETNTATVCLAKTVLRVPDESINQIHKNFAWQDLTKAQWEAIDRGYDTALLMDHRGYLTEGPGFNVAIVIDDYILTPKHNRLSGITMKFIEEACNDKITFLQSRINGNDLIQMKDMFLTSTAGDIISVTKFEDRILEESDIQKRVKELLWK